MIYGHDRHCNHNHYHNIPFKLKHNRVCAVAPFWLLHSRTYGTRRRKAGEHSQPSPSSSGRRQQQQQVKEDAVVVAAAGVTNNSVTVDRVTGAPGEPTFTGPVPRDVLTVQYSRSSGPGGQHANKVSSQAEVRFSISSAVWLTERTRLRLRTLAREQGHINKRDEVVIVSSRTRSQHKNLEDAISRVHALCTEASRLPRVATEAQKKKVAILQRAHDERRLKEKKRRKDNKRKGDGHTIQFQADGTGNRRCVTVLTPKVHANAPSPMPVLFYFHGAGGNAGHCGMMPDASGVALQDYARRYGFVLVCGEALQDAYGKGGLWAIPEVMTQRSGPRCSSKDTEDNVYMRNVVARLEQQPSIYDTKRMFTSGCSMGSAFSEFIGQCFYIWYGPSVLSAFATHSTGLKVKNDGLEFPPDNYNKSIGWGDCDACQFFPLVPRKSPGLKACLNDNTDDGVFYRSTKQMERVWKGLGNTVEAHYYP
eukprot:UC1_evm1s1726